MIPPPPRPAGLLRYARRLWRRLAPAPWKPPRFLFVDINRRCNLRCQHCLYWTAGDDDPDRTISIPRRNAILGEFAALSPRGTVVICGGESMLDPEEYFAVAGRCTELGLCCFSVINGTRVTGDAMADRMILTGPTEITVSLNSHRPEVHDATRGVTGAFDRAVRALRLLVAARRRHGSPKRLYAMAVVCEQNYRELDPFYDFVLRDIGADKLKLNFLQPTFGAPPGHVDRFFEENLVRDVDGLVAILRQCDRKYGLRLDPAWIDVAAMYHRSVHQNGGARAGWGGAGRTSEHICNSYDRNIMVDLHGNARLCFATCFPAVPLREPGDLRRFWRGRGDVRREMRRCNRYCGISHSVRRISATRSSRAQG